MCLNFSQKSPTTISTIHKVDIRAIALGQLAERNKAPHHGAVQTRNGTPRSMYAKPNAVSLGQISVSPQQTTAYCAPLLRPTPRKHDFDSFKKDY